MQVSWVWPLLDRPHRSTGESVFTDDGLATSLAGGRLDRLLQTVQLVLEQSPSLSMTLLVDPDLIDEVAVMAAGSYRVQTSGTSTAAGTGTAAAKSTQSPVTSFWFCAGNLLTATPISGNCAALTQ